MPKRKDKKNGKKSDGQQNYLCEFCKRQFIGIMPSDPIQGMSFRDHSPHIVDTCALRRNPRCVRDRANKHKKNLSVLVWSVYVLRPKQSHYATLEADEFWTYVKRKSGKVWLIYAYDRESGEIVAYVWGKRNLKTAGKLRKTG